MNEPNENTGEGNRTVTNVPQVRKLESKTKTPYKREGIVVPSLICRWRGQECCDPPALPRVLSNAAYVAFKNL